MKTLLTLSLLLASHTAFANSFDTTCLNRYRDAAVSLIDASHRLNDGSASKADFLGNLTMIESTLGATRVMCTFEPSEIKECVTLYKKQYHKIRDNVDTIEISKGNQTKVNTLMAEIGIRVVDVKCQ